MQFYLSTEVNCELVGHIKNGDMEVDSNWSLIDSNSYGGSHYLSNSYFIEGSWSRCFEAENYNVGVISDAYSVAAGQRYLCTVNLLPVSSQKLVAGTGTIVKQGLDDEYEAFTGNTLTVGPSGYDYDDIVEAFAAADAGDMLLIYPGTYVIYDGDGDQFVINKSIVIRGMGDSPSDVLLRQSHSGNMITINLTSGFVILENLETDPYSSADHGIWISACSASVNIYMNKCILDCSDWSTVGTANGANSYEGNLEVTYCYVQRGSFWYNPQYQYFGTAVSGTCTFEAQYNEYEPTYACYGCSGGLPTPHSYVETPTAGYGYAYGDYFVLPGYGVSFDTQWRCNIKILDGAGNQAVYSGDHIGTQNEWTFIEAVFTESVGGLGAQIIITHAESTTAIYHIDDIKLFHIGSETLQVYPNWDYRKFKSVIKQDHRTKTGGLFSYKSGDFNNFSFTTNYILKEKAIQINSWWQSSSGLLFTVTSGGVQEVNSVSFINKFAPFKEMDKPYTDYYNGKIELSEY